MERELSLQLPRPCTSIRASRASSHLSMRENCVFSVDIRAGEGSGLFCGRDHARQRFGIATLRLPGRICLQTRTMMMISKNPTVMKKFNGRRGVFSTMRTREDFIGGRAASQSSSRESIAVPSEDELKERLEALQEEALHVRDRCNNARSRFMRLTEAAQQLRRRAGLDLDAGNEDSARSLLVEKQKVLRAAELSKRRATLLEELSNKLGEAISKVESQLVFVLSSSYSPKEEPIVRAVAAKDEYLVSIDPEVVDTREESANIRETLLTVADVALEEIPQQLRGEDRESVNPSSNSADVRGEKGNRYETDQIHSTFRDLYSRESELEATIMEVYSDSAIVPEMRQLEDSAGQSEPDLQPKQSLDPSTPLTSLDGETKSDFSTSTGVSDFAETDISRGSSPMTIAKDDIIADSESHFASPTKAEDRIEQVDKKAAQNYGDLIPTERQAGRGSTKDIPFERYLEDIACDVAAVESNLIAFRTALESGNHNTDVENIENVGQILNQLQSLKNRISESIKTHRGKREGGFPDSLSL